MENNYTPTQYPESIQQMYCSHEATADVIFMAQMKPKHVTATAIVTDCGGDAVLNTLATVSLLFLTVTPQRPQTGKYHFSHFTDEEAET